MTSRMLGFAYGVLAYAFFLVTFLYAIGFVGGLVVTKSIDSGPAVPVSHALPVDVALLGLFAIQHSLMARPGFKQWWTEIIPEPIERSTYVLLTDLLLALLFWQWRPILLVIWQVGNPVVGIVLQAIFWLGWLVVLLSTFMIDHFELFGLRQVYLYLMGKKAGAPAFATPGFYRWVRHPIMLGFVIAFWAAPTMTAGHALFAVATTGYILAAIQLEERDLIGLFGEAYRGYRKRVPMLIPWPKLK
jgi:protein-S-isoprenylcysteine O-methyltransferase Ste14